MATLGNLSQMHSLPPEEQERIMNGPALPPPEGTVPNLDNPPNNNVLGVFALTLIFLFPIVSALLRAYGRIVVVKLVRWEDYLALISVGAFVAALSLSFIKLAHSGFLVHQWDTRMKDMAPMFYGLNVMVTIYGICVCPIKVAILTEWRRIFVPAGTRNTFWWASQVLIVLNIIYYTASIIFNQFICSPREKIWDKTIPGGHCVDNNISDITSGVINLVSDVMILILPQSIIWKLNMPLKDRLGLAFIFCIGVLTCVCAAARFGILLKWMGNEDVAYMLDSVALWVFSEMSCMILVFCVPAVPKTFGWLQIISPLTNTLQSWWARSRRRSAEAMELFGLGSRSRSNPVSSSSTYHNMEALESQIINALPSDVAIMRTPKFETSEEQINGQFST